MNELLPIHILNIEDSKHDSLLLKLELEQSTLQIELFERVQTRDELINALEIQSWDIIICDFYLPGFDVFEALDIIHNQPKHIPVILYSGQVSTEDTLRSLEAGAEEYVSKNNRQLIDIVIKRVIYSKQQDDDLSKTKERVKNLEETLNLTSSSLNIGLWEWQIELGKVVWNDCMYQLYGISKNQFNNNYKSWLQWVHPDDIGRLEEEIKKCFDNKSLLSSEFRIIRPDKGIRVISVYGTIKWNSDNVPLYMHGINQDVTQLHKMHEDLYIASSIFDERESAIAITDKNEQFVRVNRKYSEITGFSQEELIGQTPRIVKSGKHDADFYKAMWKIIHKHGEWRGGIWNKRKDGQLFFQLQSISVVRDQGGKIEYYISNSLDSSIMTDAQIQAYCLAHYDSLTSLPNRYLIADTVRKAFNEMKHTGQHGALLFIDLDRFKLLNDSLGHLAGDEIIKTVAKRLRIAVRQSDVIARLGGNEFLILLNELDADIKESIDVVYQVANKIRMQINLPFEFNDHEYYLTCSIGCLLFPEGIDNSDKLYSLGDIALQKAKERRDNIQFYNVGMRKNIESKLSIEYGLRKAIETDHLQLYFQVQILHGQAVSAEALLRWNDVERGWISPAEFIPIAENSGLIFMLGDWVLRQACQQIKEWEEKGLFNGEFRSIAINLSAIQFEKESFVSQLIKTVKESGIQVNHLTLELTESVIIEGETYHENLQQLKQAGFELEIDDFGTGYCSFDYLKKLNVNSLKIDQSFVRDIAEDDNDLAIVKAIIAMAEALKINVIAEGVEHKLQVDLLNREGCYKHQGYFYSRPIPADDMFLWVAENNDE